VDDHRVEVDELITRFSKGWTIDRMPVMDRTVLRVAVYELLAHREVPVAVILSEAVQLANRYSTDDSGRFVNGLLAGVASVTRER
jgi:N utilization substance protein B